MGPPGIIPSLVQANPIWWLQDDQNPAPTMSVLAPLPPSLLPQHGYTGRVLEACKGPSCGQQAYGESTVWVLLASSAFWLQVDPRWWLKDDKNHAPTIGVTRRGWRGDHDHGRGGEGGKGLSNATPYIRLIGSFDPCSCDSSNALDEASLALKAAK